MQAELALLSGRCTVPVVVVRGQPLDGDEQHGSVVEALASGALERAVADDSPWAPAWPTTGVEAPVEPPPVVVMKRCRVCRQRYSDAENSAAACKHHPGTLRGESSRKVRRPRPVSSLDGVALVRLRAPSARPGVFDVHPRLPRREIGRESWEDCLRTTTSSGPTPAAAATPKRRTASSTSIGRMTTSATLGRHIRRRRPKATSSPDELNMCVQLTQRGAQPGTWVVGSERGGGSSHASIILLSVVVSCCGPF